MPGRFQLNPGTKAPGCPGILIFCLLFPGLDALGLSAMQGEESLHSGQQQLAEHTFEGSMIVSLGLSAMRGQDDLHNGQLHHAEDTFDCSLIVFMGLSAMRSQENLHSGIFVSCILYF